MKKTGRHKCREIWPDSQMEKAYSLFLDTFLLLAPLLLMVVAYWLIGIRLWKGFNETIGPTPFQPVVNQVNNTSKQTQPMLEPNEPLANKSVSSCSGNNVSLIALVFISITLIHIRAIFVVIKFWQVPHLSRDTIQYLFYSGLLSMGVLLYFTSGFTNCNLHTMNAENGQILI